MDGLLFIFPANTRSVAGLSESCGSSVIANTLRASPCHFRDEPVERWQGDMRT